MSAEFSIDLSSLLQGLGYAQPTPTPTQSPTYTQAPSPTYTQTVPPPPPPPPTQIPSTTQTAQTCPSGYSCIDVSLCGRAGGTCVASCSYGCCCALPPQATPPSSGVVVSFSTTNDPYYRYVVVCADKTWGSPGCQPWTGDWVSSCYGSCKSPPINAQQFITAVTSASGYTWDVDVYVNGQLVQHCTGVDRDHPCVAQIAAVPTQTPTYPTPSVSFTPAQTPTQSLPPFAYTPTQTPTPTSTTTYTIDLSQLVQQYQPVQTQPSGQYPGWQIMTGGSLGGGATPPSGTPPSGGYTPVPTATYPTQTPQYTPPQTPTQTPSVDVSQMVEQLVPVIILVLLLRMVL
ncbi:MAG: hypothetical protein ACP5I3_09990 [Thermoproteus sp.]